ncbi:MAG TPA: TIGR04086 family membrane protein [Clostridia bacterium]|nr:TIGR04086 family membrane protein [Clostridia bacterium]
MRKMINYAKKAPAEEKGINIYGVFLKSLGICFTISFALIVLYALILSFTSMSDSSMNMSIQIIMIVSITISSIYGGKKISRKGWLFGIALGLLFTLLLVPLSVGFGQNFSLDKYFMAKTLMGGAVGLIGGIIGVNLN